MLVGHLAVGLAGKWFAPKISLGTLVLAALAADLLWCLFLITGIERVQIIQRGTTLMNSVALSEISYSHGLLMDAVWAAGFAVAYFLLRHSARSACVLFAAVLSHWVLDFVSHKPDMPLTPGGHRVFGLGLWTSIPATLVVEGGVWLMVLIVYARATKTTRLPGTYAFWGGVVLFTAAWYNNIAGPPPPPNMATAAISSFIFFSIVVAWAYWMNRARTDSGDIAEGHAAGR